MHCPVLSSGAGKEGQGLRGGVSQLDLIPKDTAVTVSVLGRWTQTDQGGENSQQPELGQDAAWAPAPSASALKVQVRPVSLASFPVPSSLAWRQS